MTFYELDHRDQSSSYLKFCVRRARMCDIDTRRNWSPPRLSYYSNPIICYYTNSLLFYLFLASCPIAFLRFPFHNLFKVASSFVLSLCAHHLCSFITSTPSSSLWSSNYVNKPRNKACVTPFLRVSGVCIFPIFQIIIFRMSLLVYLLVTL